MKELYNDCINPQKPDPYDRSKPPSTSDLGQCKSATLQRLALSHIDIVDPPEDGPVPERCNAEWIPDKDEPGKGTIRVTQPKGVDCSAAFPDDRAKRIDIVRQAAYEEDWETTFEGVDDFATLAARLYAFCDTSLGVKDPAACKKKQLDLLNAKPEESNKVSCLKTPEPDDKVLFFNPSCGSQFALDAQAQQDAVKAGIATYTNGQPSTLTGLVKALYEACAARQQKDDFTNVQPCWDLARKVGADIPYEFKEGDPGDVTCRASLDSTGSHIILFGDRATCDREFPKNGDARGAAVIDGSKSFEQGAALSGATDVASAVTKLYAFCDTGKGGDPATCKTEGLATLQKIKIIRVEDLKDCTARVTIVDGEAAIEIGDDCGTQFPTSSTDWQNAIDTATPLADRSATVQGATDLASTKAALYAFCDSGKGGDPVTCKKDADALLSAPILRTGTSCTPTITTVGGKSAIVVGPNCQKPFPDDPTLRASVLGAADTQAQLVTALNGATDLAAATKALYAYCDSGKAGDPVACKKAADAVLRDTPIVRTGTECTAAVANEGGKPVIVIGPTCAATAFPDDPTARANIAQQAATANVAPVTPPPATPPPVTTPPASSSAAPQSTEPPPKPTSTSVPDKPPVVKPEVVKPEVVKPEVVKPEVVKPEVVKPEVVKPEVVKPEVVKPEVVEPPAEKKATEPS